MQIVLTKDLNPNKGLVKGAVLDWPKVTISSMSNQLGKEDKKGNFNADESWYRLAAQVERSANRQTLIDTEARNKRASISSKANTEEVEV
tara:strand:- start:3033 stop:3302 length:270 start_codon:yes stop_codon:yes gene_type:complete